MALDDILKIIYLLFVNLSCLASVPSLAAGVLLLSLFLWALYHNFSHWRRR